MRCDISPQAGAVQPDCGTARHCVTLAQGVNGVLFEVMPTGPQPQSVEIIGDHLAIRWSDRAETLTPLATLRQRCPCATCAGEPDGLFQGSGGVPQAASPNRAVLQRIEWVGAYALRPVWADGHSTGIYSFDSLRNFPESPADTSKDS